MQVRVTLASHLAQYAGGERHVKVVTSKPTVAGVVDAIGALHPGVRDRVLDDQGALRRHVNVFVDEENARFTGGLQSPVRDGSEISILPAVSGG